MTQTKTGSFVEALTNIGIGFALNFGINLATLPLLWNPDSPKLSAFYIGLVFTAVSLVRQFVLRRWFNKASFGNVPETRRTYTPKRSQFFGIPARPPSDYLERVKGKTL